MEYLDIKKFLFEKVEFYRKAGTLISSNISEIPIHLMTVGRSEDFRKNYGTHFFNLPRYLKILKILLTTKTTPQIIRFLMDYGSRFLGKTTILCKYTPDFIVNHIRLLSIINLFHTTKDLGLSVEEVDPSTNPIHWTTHIVYLPYHEYHWSRYLG